MKTASSIPTSKHSHRVSTTNSIHMQLGTKTNQLMYGGTCAMGVYPEAVMIAALAPRAAIITASRDIP